MITDTPPPPSALPPPVQPRSGAIGRAQHHLTNPISRTAYSLILNSGLTAAGGFAYWVIAGRQFSPEAVGEAGALISALTLVSALGQLNLSGTLMRFLPGASRRSATRLIVASYGIAVALTGLLSVLALAFLRSTDIANGRLTGPQVVLAAAAWALFSLQDSVLVGLRRAPLVPIENFVFAIAKIVLLVSFVDRTSTAIVMSWALPLLTLIPIINWLVFRRFLPAHDEQHGSTLDLSIIRRFLFGDATTGLLQQAAVWVLPLLVTQRLGARQNAGFYLALITSMTLDLLVSNLTSALTVEAAHDPENMHELLRTTVRRIMTLVPIAVVVVAIFAPWVMRVYGSHPASAVTTLRVLALGSIPRSAVLVYQALCRVEHTTHRSALLQLGLVTTIVTFSWLTVGRFGIVAVAFVVFAANCVAALVVVPHIRKHLGSPSLRSRFRIAALPDTMTTEPIPVEVPASTSRIGPVIFLVAVGILLHAMAAGGSRHDAWWAVGLYWASLLVMFIPCASVVVSTSSSDRDRVIASMVLGAGILIARFVLYPNLFAYHDELMHMNTVRLIVDKHRLFVTNSALPVSTYYPGLEVVTAGFHSLTGLSEHVSGMLLLMFSRLIMTLSLIGTVRRVTGSVRIGCMAALVYTTNPQYLWFNSQFAYQSLALPLTLATVYVALGATNRSRRWSVAGASILAIGVAVTHHLTSVALLVSLTIWWLIERRKRGESLLARVVGGVAAVLTIFIALWTATVGDAILSYIASIGQSSIDSLVQFFRGQDRHELFSDYSGYRTPVWERVLSLSSVALIMVLLVPSTLAARSWLKRTSSIAIFLALVGITYPIIPGGHLTRATSEVSDRASGFLYVGLGFLFAWWIARKYVTLPPSVRRLVVGGLVVLFVGGTVVGSGPQWLRLPGPYQAAADNRSVDEYNLATSRWMQANLSSDNPTLSDRINRLLVSSIGQQYSVTHIGDGVESSPVFFDPEVTQNVLSTLHQGKVVYVVMDTRTATQLPRVGVYLEQGEENSYKHKVPINPRAFTKFDTALGVSRIYDNGHVLIFDVRELLR